MEKLDFKNWIINEIRYKGLYRMWQQKNPEMPKYAQHDLYTHNFGYAMRHLLKNTDDTSMNQGGYTRDNNSPIPSNSPDRIFDSKRAKEIKDIIWAKKPQIISINPNDIEPETLDIIKYRNFGYKAFEQIPRDAERTETQRKLTNTNGKNEPVIIVKTMTGYKLVEGWHRTMSILLQGAPPEQLEMVKKGDYSKVDFSKWAPVKINAYIGIKKENKPVMAANSTFDNSQTVIYRPQSGI